MPFSWHGHPLASKHDHNNEHSLPWPTDLWLHSNMNIKTVDLFLSLSCAPHIAHTMDLSVIELCSTHCSHHGSFCLWAVLHTLLTPWIFLSLSCAPHIAHTMDLSVFELCSTHCSHHGSFSPWQYSHLTFFLAIWFTSLQYCWPYTTLIDSRFQP